MTLTSQRRRLRSPSTELPSLRRPASQCPPCRSAATSPMTPASQRRRSARHRREFPRCDALLTPIVPLRGDFTEDTCTTYVLNPTCNPFPDCALRPPHPFRAGDQGLRRLLTSPRQAAPRRNQYQARAGQSAARARPPPAGYTRNRTYQDMRSRRVGATHHPTPRRVGATTTFKVIYSAASRGGGRSQCGGFGAHSSSVAAVSSAPAFSSDSV
jgi:hypothetical protein